MRPVFVSRPTWVVPEHRAGLEYFKNLLSACGLEPRSIGVTDRPGLSPLEEVIRLMKLCFGAIVLGIPQIEIQLGTVKGEQIRSPLSLGTEWNHIEAALAYSLNMPVLVIHDATVGRGIFDPGAANAFIYTVEFSSAIWPLTDEVSGAMRDWSKSLARD